MAQKSRVLVYLLRRDLRIADNPVFHEISQLFQQSERPFTHVLPLFVVPANQMEVSGLLSSPNAKSPYPEARSPVGGFWRCGHLRAKFIAESLWDLKDDLDKLGSGMVIRAGMVPDVMRDLLRAYRDKEDVEVTGVWLTSDDCSEEKAEERGVQKACREFDTDCKIWPDRKYLLDDRDLPFKEASELSDVFTSFRKTVEPLRDAPRKNIATPTTLPPLPDFIPPQADPFTIPDTLDSFMSALTSPLYEPRKQIEGMPTPPPDMSSAHPFKGGATAGHERIQHLITSGSMSTYKDTRNGLLGTDFSTKLSAWLALGCITGRQVHWYLVEFEDGSTPLGQNAVGYGKGENKGTAAVRFELLWRDYMRLCSRKFGPRLFRVEGFRDDHNARWKYTSSPCSSSTDRKNRGGKNDDDTAETVRRFIAGRTGAGLIDASQRELYLTGYTSNRARQNVASYLAKHLGIDWRVGAEWYESNLIDYDVHSNWGNWQYVAGVGNDPRGEHRVFNPVKQALDYDPQGEYIRAWVPELRDVKRDTSSDVLGVFQAWCLPKEEVKRLGLEGVDWVEKPLVKIEFSLNRRGGGMRRGPGGGGREGRGRGGGGGGRGKRGNRGKEARTGMMEKAGFSG